MKKNNLFILVTTIAIINIFSYCAKKNSNVKENISFNLNSGPDQEKALNERVKSYINSLDIRMELKDSILIGNVDALEMTIINNSDYQLLAASRSQIKHFGSGLWKRLQGSENEIMTESQLEPGVQPQSKRSFIENISYRNLPPGKYRIEQEFNLRIPSIKHVTNYYRITLSDEFVIL